MLENFQPSMPHILEYEGGYSNNPKDPGGPTNHGITWKVYNAWRRINKLPIRDVRLISFDEVYKIYKDNYWDCIRGDQLPVGIDFAMFDFAVNSGVSRSIRYAQLTLAQSLNRREVKADSHVGPITLNALHEVSSELFIKLFNNRRRVFIRSLSTYSEFGKGWDTRITKVTSTAIAELTITNLKLAA